jgi:hypothetical protein
LTIRPRCGLRRDGVRRAGSLRRAAREDVAKRTILEVTVAAKTRRSIIFAPFTHPDGRLRERWGVRCGYGVSSRYAVGDPIEIVFRYKKSIGGKGHWAHPTIVKLKPYRIEDRHTVTGYDS